MADDGARGAGPGQPDPWVAAEQRARAAIEAARAQGNPQMLVMQHAQLGMILAARAQFVPAVGEYRKSLELIAMLRLDGQHDEQRLLRMTSLATPPPGITDFDLARMELEIRLAMAEAMAAGGDLAGAREQSVQLRPQARGFLRRGIRQRLDRIDAQVAAGSSVADTGLAELQQHAARATDPAQERALRLRIASRLLDSGDAPAATREALLLVRSADEAGDIHHRAAARQVLGLALEAQGRGADALPILSDAYRDLRAGGDLVGMVGMAEALAARLVTAGDPAAAATVLRTGADAARSRSDREAELSIRTMLGSVLDQHGDRAASLQVFAEAVAAAEEADLRVARADALHGWAVVLGRRPDPDDLVEALSMLDQAKRLYLDHAHPERAAGCDHESAALLGRVGSYDAALARYHTARSGYLDLPPEQRDAGSWPDEVADCDRNLAWLSGPRQPMTPDVFRSGGHFMSHPAVLGPAAPPPP
jgi:tetratricopeptide (TPR) repeat protein